MGVRLASLGTRVDPAKLNPLVDINSRNKAVQEIQDRIDRLHDEASQVARITTRTYPLIGRERQSAE